MYAVSIAGHDPSEGAGIGADLKTFEAHGLLGLGVVTAITYQVEDRFEGLDWVERKSVLRQLDLLLKRYQPRYFKIGIVESFGFLSEILELIHKNSLNPVIVWDPVLKATASKESFHQEFKKSEITDLLKKVTLITPNLDEMKLIFPDWNPETELPESTSLLLKGGHSDTEKGTDILFQQGMEYALSPTRIIQGEKHGTGCVLSSAICSQLVLGNNLKEACQEAKDYLIGFLESGKDLLGTHQPLAKP